MNSSSRKMLRYFKKWWVITGIIVLVLIVLFVISQKAKPPVMETGVVTKGDVIERVSVTGKVSPIEKADLAFQKGGVLAAVNVKVGDHVSRGQILAMLDASGDAAALKSAEAQLAEVRRGLRPEEYAADEATVLAAQTTLNNSKKSGLSTARDAYAKAQSSVVNYVDQFYNNPQSNNPSVNFQVDLYTKQLTLNNKRVLVNEALSNWKADIDSPSFADDVPTLLSRSEKYLTTIKDLMSDLSSAVNDLNTHSSNLPQATINAYVAAMNTGLSTLTTAFTSVTTAESSLQSSQAAYKQSQEQFKLQLAGSSAETITAQTAKVDQARAEYNKDMLISPIDGIVTKADPNVGEFVSGGVSSFGVQSDGTYKIEARVPEADIAKVAVGNSADVTLDAYGSDAHFPAIVSTIDPAETVLEGVPTYKVTLHFTQADNRIRSGMTANTDILTNERKDVVNIPTRAIVIGKGTKTVRVLRVDGKTYDSVNVTTGLKGSDGRTEILSGLNVGQTVVTYVK